VTPTRYSLTVRGGVSLGAYEGGINWATLRLLEQEPGVDLTTVTGASAGNINAFFSAIEWCQDRAVSAKESSTDNMFWNAWVPVGIHSLFPRGQAHGYAEGDGLLTRSAFAPAEAALRAALAEQGRFPKPCPLRVGVSVTRVRPADMVLQSADSAAKSEGIHIPTQRFVATFDVRTDGGGLRFEQRPAKDFEMGENLMLPSPDGVLSAAQVVDLIHASSAFPVAFGPKVIRHCPDDRDGTAQETSCDDKSATPDKFIDGGVFDNIPLGLAVNLTNQVLDAKAAEQVHYLYLDPDHARSYRKAVSTSAESPNTKSVGLSNTLDFISSFVEVSEQYELQTVARYLYKPENGNRPTTPLPRLSSRFHPLVGTYLAHFGAFLARPFREHDFFVGIYDGLANRAREQCSIFASARPLTTAEGLCFAEKIRDGHDRLGLARVENAAASYMVRRLLDTELRAALTQADRAIVSQRVVRSGESLDTWLAARDRLAETGTSPPRIPMLRVLVDVLSRDVETAVPPCECSQQLQPNVDRDLTDIVDELRACMAAAKVDADRYFTDVDERAFLRRPVKWLRNAEIDAAERLDQIENIDGYPLGEHITALAQMVLQTEPLRPIAPIDLDPSSIPDRRLTTKRLLFHLLPYEISGDVLHSGWDVAYRPTFGPEGARFALVLPMSPWTWRRSTHEIFQSAGAGILFAPDFVLWTGLEAFAKAQCQQLKNNCTVGGELGVYLLAGKLHVAASIDKLVDVKWPDTMTINVGLADINGLIYWGLRQAVQ
jgi:predicted acylesterase/phospholipase RssA